MSNDDLVSRIRSAIADVRRESADGERIVNECKTTAAEIRAIIDQRADAALLSAVIADFDEAVSTYVRTAAACVAGATSHCEMLWILGARRTQFTPSEVATLEAALAGLRATTAEFRSTNAQLESRRAALLDRARVA